MGLVGLCQCSNVMDMGENSQLIQGIILAVSNSLRQIVKDRLSIFYISIRLLMYLLLQKRHLPISDRCHN